MYQTLQASCIRVLFAFSYLNICMFWMFLNCIFRASTNYNQRNVGKIPHIVVLSCHSHI